MAFYYFCGKKKRWRRHLWADSTWYSRCDVAGSLRLTEDSGVIVAVGQENSRTVSTSSHSSPIQQAAGEVFSLFSLIIRIQENMLLWQ